MHLGAPLSRGRVAAERAVAWIAVRKPDLVCITGDLVSHPRGESQLAELLEVLGRPYVVLGNHDVAVTRDPFSRAAELEDLREAVLLRDEAVDGGVWASASRSSASIRRATAVGRPTRRVSPIQPRLFESSSATSRGVGRRLRRSAFHLILAGHLHAGQITIPFPTGRSRSRTHGLPR